MRGGHAGRCHSIGRGMLARPMRGVAVFVLLLVLVAAVLILQGLGAFTSEAPPADPSHPAAPPLPSVAAKVGGETVIC